MKKPNYGQSTPAAKQYQRSVVEHMKKKGWNLYRTAKHFHHIYGTLKKWIDEYEAEQHKEKEPIVIYEDMGEADQHAIKWAPDREKCIGCIKLEAQLEVYKAIVQQYLGASA